MESWVLSQRERKSRNENNQQRDGKMAGAKWYRGVVVADELVRSWMDPIHSMPAVQVRKDDMGE